MDELVDQGIIGGGGLASGITFSPFIVGSSSSALEALSLANSCRDRWVANSKLMSSSSSEASAARFWTALNANSGKKNARKMPKGKKRPKTPIFHVLWHFY